MVALHPGEGAWFSFFQRALNISFCSSFHLQRVRGMGRSYFAPGVSGAKACIFTPTDLGFPGWSVGWEEQERAPLKEQKG